MTLIDSLLSQGVRALSKPRAAAADVIALGVPREALAPALFLVVVLSVILNGLIEMIAPNPLIRISPFQMALMATLMMPVFAFAVARIGRFMGGHGQFSDSLLLVIFWQALFVPATAIQVVLFLVSPVLSAVFIFAAMLFLTWIYINFVAALHGFQSLGPAFGVLLLSMLAFMVVMAFVMPFFVTVVGAPESV